MYINWEEICIRRKHIFKGFMCQKTPYFMNYFYVISYLWERTVPYKSTNWDMLLENLTKSYADCPLISESINQSLLPQSGKNKKKSSWPCPFKVCFRENTTIIMAFWARGRCWEVHLILPFCHLLYSCSFLLSYSC